MLKILNYEFEEDFSERESAIFFINDDKNPFMSVDCVFYEKEIEEDSVRPIIGIDRIYTDVRERDRLVGEGKQCVDFEESEEDEDYLYFYDQEPFQNYEFEIVEVIEHRAHIVCKGVATLDSDEEPMITVEFEWDAWLPIIEDYNDWDKYGLDNICCMGEEGIEVESKDTEITQILEKMYKKRFLSKGIRQIEDYERMNIKIREYNNYECIIPLSKVLVDETQCASATEGVVETIAILVDNHKRLAIREVLYASADLVKQGRSWLNRLYRMIFLKKENVEFFKEEYQKLDGDVRNGVSNFLKFQLENKYISSEIYEEIVGLE